MRTAEPRGSPVLALARDALRHPRCSPRSSPRAPQLLGRSRAIDFSALPFKTLLARRPACIVSFLGSKISLLLLQLFPNQHLSGLTRSAGGPPTGESMRGRRLGLPREGRAEDGGVPLRRAVAVPGQAVATK